VSNGSGAGAGAGTGSGNALGTDAHLVMTSALDAAVRSAEAEGDVLCPARESGGPGSDQAFKSESDSLSSAVRKSKAQRQPHSKPVVIALVMDEIDALGRLNY